MKIILQNKFYIRDVFNFLKKENLDCLECCKNGYFKLFVYNHESNFPKDLPSINDMLINSARIMKSGIAKFLLKKLAFYDISKGAWLDYIVEGSCLVGNAKQADKYIGKDHYYEGAASTAAEGNQPIIMRYFINKGGDCILTTLAYAIKSNNIDCIKHILNIDSSAYVLNRGLSVSASDGNWRLLKFFISKGANDWNSALNSSIYSKDFSMVKFLAKNATEFLWPWKDATDFLGENSEITKFLGRMW